MSRDFSINNDPDEVLRLMEANMSGNQNYQMIGSAWLAYKAGELNAKATKRLAWATWVLVFTSAVLAFLTALQLIKTWGR